MWESIVMICGECVLHMVFFNFPFAIALVLVCCVFGAKSLHGGVICVEILKTKTNKPDVTWFW